MFMELLIPVSHIVITYVMIDIFCSNKYFGYNDKVPAVVSYFGMS